MSDPNTKSPIDLTGTHTVISNEELEATRSEVHAWFFEDYLPRWVAASSGKSGEGSSWSGRHGSQSRDVGRVR